jgi:predicted O-methyltransferase YrrM
MPTSMRERLRAAAIALRNLILGANISALTIGSPRGMVHYASEALFLRRALAGRRGLPEQQVWDAFGSTGDVAVRLANVDTPTWAAVQPSYLADIVNLCRLCVMLRPRVVFEIGTYHGYSTLHLALNTGGDARILSLDLPKQPPASGAGSGNGPGAGNGNGNGNAAVADGVRPTSLRTTFLDDAHISGATGTTAYLFDGTPEAGRIELLFGDSASFDFSPFAGAVDLFFIDGAHSYEYVRSDTLRALQCVRPGGVIAWHDFGRSGLNGVSRWLLEMRRQGWPVLAAPGGSLAFMVVPQTPPAGAVACNDGSGRRGATEPHTGEEPRAR